MTFKFIPALVLAAVAVFSSQAQAFERTLYEVTCKKASGDVTIHVFARDIPTADAQCSALGGTITVKPAKTTIDAG